MSERIKQLARESGLLVHNPEGVPTKLEKFAELIVRECADFVSNDRGNDEYGVFVANRIKEHFGVQE
jgi:hypothetical protein